VVVRVKLGVVFGGKFIKNHIRESSVRFTAFRLEKQIRYSRKLLLMTVAKFVHNRRAFQQKVRQLLGPCTLRLQVFSNVRLNALPVTVTTRIRVPNYLGTNRTTRKRTQRDDTASRARSVSFNFRLRTRRHFRSYYAG